MKKVKIYGYEKCSTCRNAIQFLNQRKVAYDSVSIVESPPSIAELKMMLRHVNGEIKKLFNTSGIQYREMKMSEKLRTMSESEAIQLLAQNGKLIKRPFLIGENFGMVGFQEQEWGKAF